MNSYRAMRERDSGISYCYNCGADLRQESAEQITEGSYGLWAIKRLYEILETGVYAFHGGYVYSFLFFEVLRSFVRAVYYWGRTNGLMDHEVMSRDIDFRRQRMRNNLIENIPLKEQYLLFSGLVRLLEGYPGRMLSFCGVNRFRGSDLTRDMRCIPFWYQRITDSFDMSMYSVSLEEVKNAIRYLKKKRIIVNKANVARMLGVCPDFKSEEMGELFKK